MKFILLYNNNVPITQEKVTKCIFCFHQTILTNFKRSKYTLTLSYSRREWHSKGAQAQCNNLFKSNCNLSSHSLGHIPIKDAVRTLNKSN